MNRFLGDVAEPVDLHGSPRLDVDQRIGVANHPHHVEVPVERLLVVQPADDMNLCRPRLSRLQHPSANHLVIERVSLLGLQVGPEGTKDAAIDTDVGGIEVDVGVVERQVSVLAFPDCVGQVTEEQEVSVLVEIETVFKRHPLTALDRLGDGRQPGIGGQVARELVHPSFAPDACRSTRLTAF